MTPDEEKLIDECIESHYNMIKRHRRQIIELCRRKAREDAICMECFDFEIIDRDKSG